MIKRNSGLFNLVSAEKPCFSAETNSKEAHAPMALVPPSSGLTVTPQGGCLQPPCKPPVVTVFSAVTNLAIFFILALLLSACSVMTPFNKFQDPTQITALEPAALLKFSDLPIPSTFKLVSGESYAFQSSNFRAGLLKYSGKAGADQVVVFFKEQMPMYNWHLINIVEYGRRLLSFEKDQETCIVAVDDKGSRSEVVISIAPKSQAAPRKASDKPIK